MSKRVEKIGIYGGTFDPVHHGHLILARDAVSKLSLDILKFVPALRSPHKRVHSPAPARARLEMLRAAVQGEPKFDVDEREMRREEPSFSIETVIELKEEQPHAHLFYLIGEDNVAELDTWHRIEELRMLVTFVVFTRTETPAAHTFPCITRRIDISSTEIRGRVANSESIRYLVPEEVAQIITRHNLYKELPSPPKN